MHMSSAPERSSEHPAFLPASCTDSQTASVRPGVGMQRAFLLAEQAVRGCLTRLSVHYRVIFILHRQVGTAGTNRCRCVQLARANKAKLARERRVQKTARANRPCELQAWAVVRAGCARLSPRNNGSCGAVRQPTSMARSWFAAPAVVARLHDSTRKLI